MVMAPSENLGFLSVFQEGGGHVGGYLVTNPWGRPLEFRLSSAVQPTKVHQILYGDTLQAYLCGELIGKTLIEKTATPVQCVVTDNPLALDLRLRLEIPVALMHAGQDGSATPPGLMVKPNLYCHGRYPGDVDAIRDVLAKIHAIDLSEPFARVKEAMVEARKMGVTSRNAA